VMYHYVRNLPESRFPKLKGMLLSEFRSQVGNLQQEYEMATPESAVAFLNGHYKPRRDLCLLTFDDGLQEHYTDVAPILADHKICGIFFVITGCTENSCVAPVHMNHFLMAELGFQTYRELLLRKLKDIDPDSTSMAIDRRAARLAYSWDTDEVAEFKYAFNFLFDPRFRDQAVRLLFEEHVCQEAVFSKELYFSWREAREMQGAGLCIGGHSHQHRPLSTLAAEELRTDLNECRRLLSERLEPQALWPFCYPYGRRDSFNAAVIRNLQAQDFACAFSTETGPNEPGCDLFSVRRTDCNRAMEMSLSKVTASA
jgi:peptidoglycan/xylan/chitin deacetylase (PgdA/CDA1 family)